MPRKLFEPGNPGGGRKKGSKNKATRDIKALIQSTVNFSELTKKLVKKANDGERWAFELLLEYGYGKPTNIQISAPEMPGTTEKPIQHEHTHTVTGDTIAALAELARTYRRPKAGT